MTLEHLTNMEIKETKNDNIEQLNDTPVEMAQDNFVPFNTLVQTSRFLSATASAPTDIPRTPLEYFRLYNNGGTRRLYVYDKASNTWHYTSLS